MDWIKNITPVKKDNVSRYPFFMRISYKLQHLFIFNQFNKIHKNTI